MILVFYRQLLTSTVNMYFCPACTAIYVAVHCLGKVT